MAVKVAINGFGRIGRLAFRQMLRADMQAILARANIPLRPEKTPSP